MTGVITIYGKEGCHACKQVKEFFDKNNKKYIYIDIEKDITPLEYTAAFNILTVPLTTYKNEKILGFSLTKLQKLL